jgi:hypothetical protein
MKPLHVLQLHSNPRIIPCRMSSILINIPRITSIIKRLRNTHILRNLTNPLHKLQNQPFRLMPRNMTMQQLKRSTTPKNKSYPNSRIIKEKRNHDESTRWTSKITCGHGRYISTSRICKVCIGDDTGIENSWSRAN